MLVEISNCFELYLQIYFGIFQLIYTALQMSRTTFAEKLERVSWLTTYLGKLLDIFIFLLVSLVIISPIRIHILMVVTKVWLGHILCFRACDFWWLLFWFSIEDSCFYVKFSCSVEWICLHLSDLIYWWGHWRWNCHWRWKCDRYLHYCFFWACETCNRKHKMATFSHCCFPILSFCVGGICWFFVK